MMVAPEAYHLRHQNRQRDLNEQEVYRLHPHQIMVNELGTQIFVLSRLMSHVSAGEWIAHAILADT